MRGRPDDRVWEAESAPGPDCGHCVDVRPPVRQWAIHPTGTTPERAAGLSTAEGAGFGTLLGAGLGAAIGAVAGNPGAGAAVGAAGGLLTGTAVGASRGGAAGYEAQRRYDNAYEQCMYAKDNQIPPGPGY